MRQAEAVGLQVPNIFPSIINVIPNGGTVVVGGGVAVVMHNWNKEDLLLF